MEEEFKDEENDFNEFWDKKLTEYEDESNKIFQMLVERHQRDFEETKNDIDNIFPLKPRDNVAIIDMKRMIEKLVKAQDYREASNLKRKLGDAVNSILKNLKGLFKGKRSAKKWRDTPSKGK